MKKVLLITLAIFTLNANAMNPLYRLQHTKRSKKTKKGRKKLRHVKKKTLNDHLKMLINSFSPEAVIITQPPHTYYIHWPTGKIKVIKLEKYDLQKTPNKNKNFKLTAYYPREKRMRDQAALAQKIRDFSPEGKKWFKGQAGDQKGAMIYYAKHPKDLMIGEGKLVSIDHSKYIKNKKNKQFRKFFTKLIKKIKKKVDEPQFAEQDKEERASKFKEVIKKDKDIEKQELKIGEKGFEIPKTLME